MRWQPDVTTGEWIRDRVDDPWRATIHDVAPRGFAAYARVLHPATRSRPVGRDWPADGDPDAWAAFAGTEVDTERATWAEAARAFGTTVHPLAQWGALVRQRGAEWNPGDWQQVTDASGWQWDAPGEGEPGAETVAALARVLAGHAGAEAPIGIGLWPGYGGLIGHMGVTPSRTFLTMTRDEDAPAGPDTIANDRMLAASTRDPFNRPWAVETWQQGILSDEISRGPQLELLHREYVLFEGELGELARPDWAEGVPWRDRELEAHGSPPSAHAPNLWWAADHSWFVASEIDWDSTIVGGPQALVDAVVAAPDLEAFALPTDASLQWDADRVNV